MDGIRDKNIEQRILEISLEMTKAIIDQTLEKFDRKNYRDSLREYEKKIWNTLKKLETLCTENKELQEKLIRDICEKTVGQAGERMNTSALTLDTHKMVIVSYLTPAVLGMEFEVGRRFCEVLREVWIGRFPKQPYVLATEEMIAEGFQRKWYQCYITQAVCMYMKKDDDCYEMTAFRNFRDMYLRTCPDGEALIEAYYRDAPEIVMRIRLSGEEADVYPRIWEQYLCPCLNDIENGQFRDCKARYVEMMQELKGRYGVENR